MSRPERCALVDVMTDHERSALLAYIAGYAPKVFDAAVAARRDRGAELLADRAATAEDEDAEDPEPFCSACGEGVGIFRSPGNAWLHWRENADGVAEVYYPGHVAALAWQREL